MAIQIHIIGRCGIACPFASRFVEYPEILPLNIAYIPCKTSLRVCPLRIVNPLSALIIIMYSIDISIDKYCNVLSIQGRSYEDINILYFFSKSILLLKFRCGVRCYIGKGPPNSSSRNKDSEGRSPEFSSSREKMETRLA